MTKKSLKFSGLSASVRLDVDQRLLNALPVVFAHWKFSVSNEMMDAPFVSICLGDDGYTIDSPFMDNAKNYQDPVDTLCCLVVELAWEHLRADPSLLCLHGAAVEIDGRLVVFPNSRKAGKSTLSLALLAAGHKLYTDDFLPLCVNDGGEVLGMSHGISPRIRLPVAKQIGATAMAYVKHRTSLSNRRYRFVKPLTHEIARFKETAPIGALIILEKHAGCKLALEEIGQSDAMKSLIIQNFSREMNAGGILETLAAIVRGVPSFKLHYEEVEPAVELLSNRLGNWKTGPDKVFVSSRAIRSAAPAGVPNAEFSGLESEPMVQASGTKIEVFKQDYYLAAPNGREIHKLNKVAGIIWKFLEQPTSASELVALLSVIFPEQAKAEITKDVYSALCKFVSSGLVHPSLDVVLSNQELDNKQDIAIY